MQYFYVCTKQADCRLNSVISRHENMQRQNNKNYKKEFKLKFKTHKKDDRIRINEPN